MLDQVAHAVAVAELVVVPEDSRWTESGDMSGRSEGLWSSLIEFTYKKPIHYMGVKGDFWSKYAIF